MEATGMRVLELELHAVEGYLMLIYSVRSSEGLWFLK